MEKAEQTQLLVEEDNDIEDSSLNLIRKSKLQNSENDYITDVLDPKDEAPTNGFSIHMSQNGKHGFDGSVPVLADMALGAENNSVHQETENNSVYYDKDEGGNFISAFSGDISTKEGDTIERSDIGSQNGNVNMSPDPVIGNGVKDEAQSNGVKAEAHSNGFSIHEAQNGNSTTNVSQHGKHGFDGSIPVLADEALEAENNGVDQETENNSVYYDKDEGIWKCRFCCWIYQSGSLCIDHIQNAKEHLNIVMSGKTFGQPDQCFNFDIKGGNLISAFSGEKSTKEGDSIESLDIGSRNGIVDTSPDLVINYSPEKHSKEDSFSALILQPSGVIDDINTKGGDTIESSDIGSPNGIVDTSPDPVIDYQHEKHTKDESISGLILRPSGVIDNINTISQETSAMKEIESDNSDLIDESDLDLDKIPLEKVLLKQKSHDLYCPNCNSCITRRVILRKRKRRSQPLGADVKHHKVEAEIETEAGASSSKPISNQDLISSNAHSNSSIPPEETYDRDREPEIFRCLACFSFFIPTGHGMKLFGRKSEKSTSQEDQILESNKNWFSSIFSPNKGRTPQQQGSLDKEIKESSNKAENAPLVIDNKNRSSLLTDRAVSPARVTDELQPSGAIKPQEYALLGNMTTDLTYKSQENDDLGVDNGKEILLDQKCDEAVTISDEVVTISYGEHAAAGDFETRLDDLETRLDGLDLIISSDRGPELHARSPAGSKYDIESTNSQDDEAMRNNFVTNNKVYIAVDIPREYELPTETLHDADTNNVRDSNSDSISTTRNQIQIIKTGIDVQTDCSSNANWEVSSKTTSYKETIVTVGAATEVASQITEEAMVSSGQVASQSSGHTSVVERRASEAGESYGIEIIKSIVYGGLVESITSLSVVSSAAGGGASTLHTLALGMANLIGGVFIICHNLYQLKYDEADDAINQMSEKNNKYGELLGKRKNFVLHAFVAILSYFIFGLLAPVIFGFSFRKSDDRELKLAVVTAASFLCILALAIAKAYVQTPPKTYLGTVLRYLILGLMVSGVSYVAGVLLERLLVDDLGLFENSTLVPTLSLPVKPSNKQAWTSF